MCKVVFIWMLLTKTITPAGEHEGHKLYTMWFKDGKVADHMYKGEVMNYIKTGELVYDEALEFESLKEDLDEEVFYTNN